MNPTFCLLFMLTVSQTEPVKEAEPVKVSVGSKAFTESKILGEIVTLLAEQEGFAVKHHRGLGGTGLVWKALLNGEIDVYVDYTGTIRKETFSSENLPDDESLRRRLAKDGILMTAPLGFKNAYSLALKKKLAKKLNIRTLSDLKRHPKLRFGFSNEFMVRDDGWPGLQQTYGFSHTQVRGMEHALAYRALDSGDIDVTEIYSTDSSVRKYDLLVLEDDLEHFPVYKAVFLYRQDLVQRAPKLVEILRRLEGKIDESEMLDMNQRVDISKASEKRAAAEFLNEEFRLKIIVHDKNIVQRIAKTTLEHLFLVIVSLSAAIFISVPLGILAAKLPTLGHFIVSAVEIVQTVPGLALLALLAALFYLIGLPSIGAGPAIAALFFYSLLPIIRNTMTGITSVPPSMKESATALGLTPLATLRLIELPMASRLILAGIKTTAVINVGYAALGGLISAGGYGQTIMAGFTSSRNDLMLEGAIPAAIMALVVKWGFELAEPFFVPKGLRLKASH